MRTLGSLLQAENKSETAYSIAQKCKKYYFM